jgi:hypothetical protein
MLAIKAYKKSAAGTSCACLQGFLGVQYPMNPVGFANLRKQREKQRNLVWNKRKEHCRKDKLQLHDAIERLKASAERMSTV